MPRLMSVAFTEQAVVERRKTVTRRKGWWLNSRGRQIIKPGDRLTLCRKVMGRKKGEPLVRLAEVEVVHVRRENLGEIVWGNGLTAEIAREGFPGMKPAEFADRFFVKAQGMDLLDKVTRIEWRYLDTRADACLRDSGCDDRSHSLRCNSSWFSVPRAGVTP